MTSSTLDLFTAVITLNAAYFGRLDRLAVEDARAGLGLATNSTPELLAQSSVELLPHALDYPSFSGFTVHKVILDTDVDELLTLAFLLGSPEVDLLGITAAYGDTALRGKLARHALSLAGREDVPVAVGELPTLRGKREVCWAGHEGKMLRSKCCPG